MNDRKTALITGVTGQDGAYLAELLLSKGYTVHGIKRRSSLLNTHRIDHLYEEPFKNDIHFKMHYGDLTDPTGLIRIIQETQPDEIYNLGAMSHVKVSFDIPEYTAETDGLGALRLLEAIRLLKLTRTRIYQASTSELYGLTNGDQQDELTSFHPRSPYAVAKLYAYWITRHYREAYNIFACNGILFNHESPLRGETFVTRKITRAVARIALGLQDKLYLGNLSASRDWGHARDYVEAMWLMLQANAPDDYVVATGVTTTVREFIKLAFKQVGITLHFRGEGVHEKAIVLSCSNLDYLIPSGTVLVEVVKDYFRPTEVEYLRGDATKALRELGWSPRTTLPELVREMVESDIKLFTRDKILRSNGLEVITYEE